MEKVSLLSFILSLPPIANAFCFQCSSLQRSRCHLNQNQTSVSFQIFSSGCESHSQAGLPLKLTVKITIFVNHSLNAILQNVWSVIMIMIIIIIIIIIMMIIILYGQPIHVGGNNQIINGIRFYMHFREQIGLAF